MRIRVSWPFVASLAVVLGGAWGAKRLYTESRLRDYRPTLVTPGRVCLAAVLPESRYRIIISNGIAHLAEMTGDQEFGAPDQDDKEALDTKAKLPMKETLAALQGDRGALGKLVMAVNKMKSEDLPTTLVVWTSEDVQKALDGDTALRAKLEDDLNTRLDGTPLESVRIGSIVNGIVLDLPVDVKVPLPDGEKTLTCRIQQPYKTLFAGAVNGEIDKVFNVGKEALLGMYREQARQVLEGGRREDVAGSLRSRIDPKGRAHLSEAPERILKNFKILVNESHMSGASSVSYEGPNRAILADVTLKLTQDGRMRLWKYSHEKPGFQLLLIADNVAIAAPKIRTELAGDDVKLTGVPAGERTDDAVRFINEAAKGSKGK
ncbi:MAG: hypothetical protein JST30_02345 [Armatimonadetes bacterium]|nr:hypothetical protein [Armatimonadota bacterium]